MLQEGVLLGEFALEEGNAILLLPPLSPQFLLGGGTLILGDLDLSRVEISGSFPGDEATLKRNLLGGNGLASEPLIGRRGVLGSSGGRVDVVLEDIKTLLTGYVEGDGLNAGRGSLDETSNFAGTDIDAVLGVVGHTASGDVALVLGQEEHLGAIVRELIITDVAVTLKNGPPE